MHQGWTIGWRNLVRHKRRRVTTGLAVGLGYGGLLLLTGYVVGAIKQTEVGMVYHQRNGHISVYHPQALEFYDAKPQRYGMTPAEQAAVRSALAGDPDVAFVG